MKSFATFLLLALSTILLSAFSMAVNAANLEFELEAHYFSGRELEMAEISFSLDGKKVCQIKSSVKTKGNNTCRFTAPAGHHRLMLDGNVMVRYEGKKVRRVVQQTFALLDAAPITTTLRDLSKPAQTRIPLFLAMHDAVLQDRAKLLGEAMPEKILKKIQPDLPADIVAAEKRLGFAIPMAFRQILTTVGPLDFGDSTMLRAKRLRRFFGEDIYGVWGIELTDLEKKLGKNAVEFAKASTMLYEHIGDGTDALVYRPSGDAQCKNGPAFYWILNDSDAVNPIINQRGQCATDEEALNWLIDTEYFNTITYRTDTALFDSTRKSPQQFQLRFDRLYHDAETVEAEISSRVRSYLN
jgi:hypothetical protein